MAVCAHTHALRSRARAGNRFLAVRDYLKRLVATGAAYQFGDIVAKAVALVTIPLYTRHVAREGYGAANSLLTSVILASIFLRVGVGEAFIRFYFDDSDQERRRRIARTATATVVWTTTLASLLAVVFSAQLSRLILGFNDPELIDCAIVGLWAFTNLEMAYAQLRVDERARAYMWASGALVGEHHQADREQHRQRHVGARGAHVRPRALVNTKLRVGHLQVGERPQPEDRAVDQLRIVEAEDQP